MAKEQNLLSNKLGKKTQIAKKMGKKMGLLGGDPEAEHCAPLMATGGCRRCSPRSSRTELAVGLGSDEMICGRREPLDCLDAGIRKDVWALVLPL